MNSETENPSLSLCVNDQQTEQPDYNRDTYMASGSTYDVPHIYTATEVQIAGITGSDRFTVTYAESASATLSVDSAWNTIKNVLAESTGAASVTLHNVVNTDVILGNGGNSHVSIDGAKRGDITTGDGNDNIAITAFSNAGSGNDFNLSTGAGDDSVAITGAAHTIANLSTGTGADNVRLSGGFTQVNIAAGDGDDVIDLAAASFDKAVINGGLGDDTIVVGVGRSAIDTLAGGAGLDTIEVRLAASEYTASVLQDLIMLKQFMADPANTGKTCLVSSLGIRVGDAETLRLFVDGQPVMVDNPPTVSAVSGGTAAESTTDAATLVSGAIVAADLDGDALTYTVLTDDVLHHGTLAVAADGSFVFTAQNGDWNGTDRFTVRIADGQGGFIDQAVAITITPTQDGPVVGNSDATGTEDTILTGKVTATDPDGDRLHYSFGIDAAGNVITRLDTAHGTAIIDPNTGVYRFIPQHDWSGSDSFAVQVSDGTSEIETPVTVVIAKQGVATNLHFRVNDQQTWTPDYTSGNFVVSDVSSFATSDVFTADQMHIDGITTGESLAVSFADADSGTIRVRSGWNTIKSVLAESDHNATVRFENAVNTDVSLGEGGDSQVTIVAAKRGDIVTASGDDTVTITAESNDNGWDNTFNISTGDGNDTVTVTGDTWTDTSIDTGAGADSVRLAGTFDDIVLKGGDGADTLDIAAASFDFATIDSGSGDDVVIIGQGQGTPDRADGGVGTDTLVVSLGAAEFTAQVQAELLSFQRFAADPANQGLVFTVATLGGLQAKNFEQIQLLVDGQPVPVVNHAPEIGTQAFVTSEDAPLNGLLTAIDPDGDAVSFSLLSGDGVTLNADGSFSFDPRGRFDALKPGQSQEVDFTYRVADSFGGSTEATAIITVTGLNDAPTPQADQTVTLRNSARTILAADLMKNDTDPEGDTLSLVAVGNASRGTVQLDTVSGEITFIPEEGFVGDATFDYTVSDEHGGFATATTTVKVVTSYGNSAPVAIDDFLLGTCGDDILVGGSGNDTLIGGGGSDTLIVNGDDMVSGGSGQDTVIVVGDTGVSIDLGLSEVETVYGSTGDDTLDASGTTGAAVIGGGGDDSIIGGSGGGTFSGGAGNDTFIVGGGDTSFDGGEGNDTAMFGSNGHAGGIGDYNVRHASDGGWVFTAPDGSSTTIRNADTVVFEDMEVIFEPVRRCAGAFRIWEDVPVTIPKALLLANDYDADGDPLTIASVDNGPYGQVSLDADGNVRFVGTPDFNGTTTFAYTISDGHGGFDSATVTIYVRPVNDTPTAQDVAITTVEDMPVIGRLVAADVDGDSLVWSLQDNAQHGTVTLAADGSYTYAPTADWNGTDNFRVRVADGVGGMVDQTVTVEVAAVNDRPVAVNDSGFHSTAGQPITFTAGDLLANDSDVEGDLLSIVSVGDAVGGTVLRNSDGTITFTPDEWSEGQVGFRYTVSDPFGATDDAVVTVNLLPPTYSRYLAEGADTIVNLTESGAQEHPQVAVLAGGGHVVVWQSAGQDGSGYGVCARVYGANGAGGNEFRLNTMLSGDQREVRVTALPDGGFLVGWQSAGQDGSGWGVFGQRFDNSGAPVGGEFRISTSISGDQTLGALTVLADGNVVAVYNSGSTCLGRVMTASGVQVSGEFQLHDWPTGTYPAVSALVDGGFVAVWQTSNQDGSGRGCYGQRFNADGTTVGDEFLINTTTSLGQAEPVVAGLPDGGFVAIWGAQNQFGSEWALVGQVFDANGNKRGGEIHVNTTVQWLQGVQTISPTADGGFVVTWQGTDHDMDWDVFGQRFDADGTMIGGEFVLSDSVEGSQQYATVAARQDGGFVVTWQTPDSSGDGIHARVYKAAGHASETLLGTSAADVYVCGGGSNADLIDNRGHASDGDKVLYTSGITQDQLWFRQVGSDLEVSIIGTSDTVTIQAWYNSASNHVSRFELADGSFLIDSHVQNLVSAMAAMSPPSSGQTSLTSEQYQQLSPTIAANWQH